MGLWGESIPQCLAAKAGVLLPDTALISAPGTRYHPQSLHTTALKDS